MKLVLLSFILSLVLIGHIRSEEATNQSTTTTESHDSLNSQEQVECKFKNIILLFRQRY
jgi:hypothetical protein